MNNRMNPASAQFVDNYYPMIDGVVRTVDNYTRLLNQASYACVAAPGQVPRLVDSYPYDIFRADSIRLPYLNYCLPYRIDSGAVGRGLRMRQFQIFHAHSPFRLGHYALWLGHRLGIKVVATFHSKYYDDVLQITGSRLLARTVTDYIVRFYKNADAVWTVNEGTAQTLQSYGYRGAITIMPNGTDYSYPEHPEYLRRQAMAHFSLPAQIPILLFVGQQIWQKNLRLVLDTTKCLKELHFPCLTVIAGTGYAEKEIQAYAKKAGLSEHNVRFTGQITDRELLQGLMLCSNLFFFPSQYDNAPITVREAAAMHLPAMLLKGSNAAENTRDGYNAFHCNNDPQETAGKLISLLSKPSLLQAAGLRAQQTFGRTWKEILPLILEQYERIL